MKSYSRMGRESTRSAPTRPWTPAVGGWGRSRLDPRLQGRPGREPPRSTPTAAAGGERRIGETRKKGLINARIDNSGKQSVQDDLFPANPVRLQLEFLLILYIHTHIDIPP